MRLLVLLVILLGLTGFWYYTHHKNALNQVVTQATDAKNAVVTTTNSGIDSAVQTALSGVGKAAPIYYLQNRNYGVSADKNICYDNTSVNSIGSIIADIQQYTKAVTCTVDPDFPSRSFTMVAPSRVNAGQYFCTDQNGVVVLIPSIASGSSFRVGIKCK